MKGKIGSVLMILGVLLAPALTVYAQDRTAVVTGTAPIYVLPDANRTPLRTAAANTVLRVRGEEGGWLKVEFQDPQYGIRTGYVETRLVRIRETAQQPMNLSIKDAEPVRSPEVAHQQQSATQPGHVAGDRITTPNDSRPALYVAPPGDGFEVYLAAAVHKKGVPVRVVDKEENATLILRAAPVEEKKVSTGSKVVNCLFLYCGGNSDKGNTSVQLVKNGEIVWSYAVNKGRGEKNRQSMAEAIAKHLKTDYFTTR